MNKDVTSQNTVFFRIRIIPGVHARTAVLFLGVRTNNCKADAHEAIDFCVCILLSLLPM